MNLLGVAVDPTVAVLVPIGVAVVAAWGSRAASKQQGANSLVADALNILKDKADDAEQLPDLRFAVRVLAQELWTLRALMKEQGLAVPELSPSLWAMLADGGVLATERRGSNDGPPGGVDGRRDED